MTPYTLHGARPRIHPSAFVHPDAVLIGDVTVGADASVWPGAVLRADFAPSTSVRARRSKTTRCCTPWTNTPWIDYGVGEYLAARRRYIDEMEPVALDECRTADPEATAVSSAEPQRARTRPDDETSEKE